MVNQWSNQYEADLAQLSTGFWGDLGVYQREGVLSYLWNAVMGMSPNITILVIFRHWEKSADVDR